MKPTLSVTQWIVAFERLSCATQQVAELANILDGCDEAEVLCDDAKRIEMKLYVLESRVRELQRRRNFTSALTPESYHDAQEARVLEFPSLARAAASLRTARIEAQKDTGSFAGELSE